MRPCILLYKVSGCIPNDVGCALIGILCFFPLQHIVGLVEVGVAPSCGPHLVAGLSPAGRVTATRAADTAYTRDSCNSLYEHELTCLSCSVHCTPISIVHRLSSVEILLVGLYPMKLMTTKCRTRLAMRKSPKALSGLIFAK